MARPFILPTALLLATVAAVAAAGPAVTRNVPYGDEGHPERRLDVYSPDPSGKGALPVVIYVHGGGWYKGDKAKVGHKPAWLTRLGHVLVSVDYRLLPAGRHPASAEDLAAAVAWARRHVGEYGGDPDKIFLMGHSTGAHLAALVASDERFLAHQGLGLEALAGVVAVDSNCYDVEAHVRSLPPDERGLYLAVFGHEPVGWREASPVTHVAAGKSLPPFLLLTADEESSTHAQTGAFARALREAGVAVEAVSFPGETHGSINGRLGRPDHAPTKAVESFLAGRGSG